MTTPSLYDPTRDYEPGQVHRVTKCFWGRKRRAGRRDGWGNCYRVEFLAVALDGERRIYLRRRDAEAWLAQAAS